MMAGTAGRATGREAVVETTIGRLRGVPGEGHIAFRGIRYARAARFEAPVPAAPRAGIVDAAGYGSVAPQTDPAPAGPPAVILAHLPRPANGPPPPRPVESEDCLHLNVWTPALDSTRRLPVMVFLHGGFFCSGSGAMGDGSRLATRGDAVVVSLNHRLNVLGFAHLDALDAGFARTGNLGMLDVVAALEWVHANIERFGGDPRRVMVFGTSGGGMKTAWLLASPRAQGLVARAGVQSGPALRFMERGAAEVATDRLLAELALPRARAADLRTLPAETLLGGYYRVMAAHPPARFTDLPGFAPVLDEALLPHHPFDPKAPAQARDVPLLIGSNADEMSFFTGNDQGVLTLDEAGGLARARALLGERADATWATYARVHPALGPAARFIRLSSDVQILLPTLAEADRKAAQGGAPVYLYRLDWRSSALDGSLGATHTIESALVLGQTGGPLVAGGAGVEAVSRAMGDAWVRFAATGSPGDGWPAWGPDAQAMHIDQCWRLEQHAFAAERAALPQP